MRKEICLRGLMLACLPAMMAQAASVDDSGKNARDMDEIIVTAQRRSERLVDVPISVDSVDQEQLELKKVNSILDLSKVSTSLRFEAHTPAFQPTLRGVGSQVQGAGVDSNVAVYVDGFYQVNNYGMGFDLPNVSNVQVLKGPQGTLFGRNATGGAILITTSEPTADLTGRVKLGYAEYNEVSAQGNVSGAVSGNVAAGVSVYYRKNDGYTRNIVTGSKDDDGLKMFNVRPDIVISNHDNLKLRLIFEHSYASNALTLGGSYPDSYNIFAALGIPVAHKPGETSDLSNPFNISKSDGGYALAEWQISDWLSLKSNTGYRHDHENFVSGGDFSPLGLLSVSALTDNKTFSQEFVLSGARGRADWVSGVNYYKNTGKEPADNVYQPGSVLTLKSQTVVSTAYAAFADLTYRATDRLFLTAGGRFSTERKVSDTILYGVVPQPQEKARWNKFTPRAVVRYELDHGTNVYGSYNKGFRSGAFTGFPPNKVDPETLDAFEVGFKHAAGIFDFNSAAFFYNYKNAQVTVIELNGLGRTVNAGNQHNYGAEVELAVHPVRQWSMSLSGAYLHAKYTDFKNIPTMLQVPVAIAPGVSVPGGWAQGSVPNGAGTWAQRSPQWTGNFATSYGIDLGAGTLQLAGNANMTSYFFHFTNEGMREPGFAKVDLNLSYTTNDKHWRAEAYVTNLTDRHTAAERIGGPFGTLALYTAPRVFGGSIGYNF